MGKDANDTENKRVDQLKKVDFDAVWATGRVYLLRFEEEAPFFSLCDGSAHYQCGGLSTLFSRKYVVDHEERTTQDI